MRGRGLKGFQVAKDCFCSLFAVVRVDLSLRRLNVDFVRDKDRGDRRLLERIFSSARSVGARLRAAGACLLKTTGTSSKVSLLEMSYRVHAASTRGMRRSKGQLILFVPSTTTSSSWHSSMRTRYVSLPREILRALIAPVGRVSRPSECCTKVDLPTPALPSTAMLTMSESLALCKLPLDAKRFSTAAIKGVGGRVCDDKSWPAPCSLLVVVVTRGAECVRASITRGRLGTFNCCCCCCGCRPSSWCC